MQERFSARAIVFGKRSDDVPRSVSRPIWGWDQKRGKPRALNSTMLDLVINYIRDNLHRNITLLELLSLVSVSPKHLCAAIKDATGKPPHQFQIECRVKRAKALLFDCDLSLANVALMVGFSSQSRLNDHFRRLSGMTPVQFRRHQSHTAH